MTEEARHEGIGGVMVVMDGPSGQRLAERLTRCGLTAHVVLPGALEHEARAGQLYLAPLSMATDAATLARRGAHLCLMPPWPAEMVTIGPATVGVAVVEHRGVVRFASAITTDVDTHGQLDASAPLKILYRERLIGALGAVLAETEFGEPLLATLPRASNMHGYIAVGSLQLALASAQTHFEDVVRLLRALFVWCAAHAEPAMPLNQQRAGDSAPENPGEQFAPIVLLALVLALPQQAPSSTRDAVGNLGQTDVVDQETVRALVDQVCQILGAPAEPSACDMGWAWLEAHGVIARVNGNETLIHRDTLERYVAIWQLGPRLRRLR